MPPQTTGDCVNEYAPNLVIAGVNKAGTTSLFMYLAQHPDICPSSIKEVSHFAPVRYGEPAPPVEAYADYFQKYTGQRYRMEATGGYFYGGRAMAEALRAQLGDDVRLIFIFREPITRAMSFFRFKQSRLLLDADLTFPAYVAQCMAMSDEALALRDNNSYWGIAGGVYDQYMQEWLAVFDARNIKVLFFEKLQRDAKAVLRETCEWLGIEQQTFLETVNITVENKTMGYRVAWLQDFARNTNNRFEAFWRANPKLKQNLRAFYYRLNGQKVTADMPADLHAQLEAYYADHNARLAAQLVALGYTDMPNWLAKHVAAHRAP